MSLYLRIILVIAPVLTCIYVAKKLKKSQMQIRDTIFWVFFSAILIILGAVPQLPTWLSDKMGFMAPVNFIFLLMIFILMIRCFLLSIKVSQLENKLNNLAEEIAIRENCRQNQNRNEAE